MSGKLDKTEETEKQFICDDGSRDIERNEKDEDQQVENITEKKCGSWKNVPGKLLC